MIETNDIFNKYEKSIIDAGFRLQDEYISELRELEQRKRELLNKLEKEKQQLLKSFVDHPDKIDIYYFDNQVFSPESDIKTMRKMLKEIPNKINETKNNINRVNILKQQLPYLRSELFTFNDKIKKPEADVLYNKYNEDIKQLQNLIKQLKDTDAKIKQTLKVVKPLSVGRKLIIQKFEEAKNKVIQEFERLKEDLKEQYEYKNTRLQQLFKYVENLKKDYLKKIDILNRAVGRIGNEVFYLGNDGKIKRAFINDEAFLEAVDKKNKEIWDSINKLYDKGYTIKDIKYNPKRGLYIEYEKIEKIPSKIQNQIKNKNNLNLASVNNINNLLKQLTPNKIQKALSLSEAKGKKLYEDILNKNNQIDNNILNTYINIDRNFRNKLLDWAGNDKIKQFLAGLTYGAVSSIYGIAMLPYAIAHPKETIEGLLNYYSNGFKKEPAFTLGDLLTWFIPGADLGKINKLKYKIKLPKNQKVKVKIKYLPEIPENYGKKQIEDIIKNSKQIEKIKNIVDNDKGFKEVIKSIGNFYISKPTTEFLRIQLDNLDKYINSLNDLIKKRTASVTLNFEHPLFKDNVYLTFSKSNLLFKNPNKIDFKTINSLLKEGYIFDFRNIEGGFKELGISTAITKKINNNMLKNKLLNNFMKDFNFNVIKRPKNIYYTYMPNKKVSAITLEYKGNLYSLLKNKNNNKYLSVIKKFNNAFIGIGVDLNNKMMYVEVLNPRKILYNNKNIKITKSKANIFKLNDFAVNEILKLLKKINKNNYHRGKTLMINKNDKHIKKLDKVITEAIKDIMKKNKNLQNEIKKANKYKHVSKGKRAIQLLKTKSKQKQKLKESLKVSLINHFNLNMLEAFEKDRIKQNYIKIHKQLKRIEKTNKKRIKTIEKQINKKKNKYERNIKMLPLIKLHLKVNNETRIKEKTKSKQKTKEMLKEKIKYKTIKEIKYKYPEPNNHNYHLNNFDFDYKDNIEIKHYYRDYKLKQRKINIKRKRRTKKENEKYYILNNKKSKNNKTKKKSYKNYKLKTKIIRVNKFESIFF